MTELEWVRWRTDKDWFGSKWHLRDMPGSFYTECGKELPGDEDILNMVGVPNVPEDWLCKTCVCCAAKQLALVHEARKSEEVNG